MSGPPGYAFQPEWNEAELEDIQGEADAAAAAAELEGEGEADRLPAAAVRLANTDWCHCGNCVVMPTARECVCCREIGGCRDIQADGCIIINEDFDSVCLKSVVLRVFNVARKDIRGGRPRVRGRAPEELDNRQYRYASYRLFTYLVHGYLGMGVRKVIPACAVERVHREFPEPSGIYVGFRRGDNDEEIEVPEHLAI